MKKTSINNAASIINRNGEQMQTLRLINWSKRCAGCCGACLVAASCKREDCAEVIATCK